MWRHQLEERLMAEDRLVNRVFWGLCVQHACYPANGHREETEMRIAQRVQRYPPEFEHISAVATEDNVLYLR